jgi:hypothetical protein
MKSILKFAFAGALVLGATASCTSTFEDINTNPHEATEDMLEMDNLKVGSFFSQMLIRMVPFTAGGSQDDSFGSTGAYQHFQGLNSDWYSGYIGPTGTWRSGNHNANYSFSGTWGNTMWRQNFTQIMPAWQKVSQNAKQMNLPQVAALANIVKVWAMHRVADYYGPMPYSSFSQGSLKAGYDSQEDVYKQFFTELDSAIDILAPFAQAGVKIMSSYDNIYQGDASKWAKLGNTLRLRLALRIVYANPELAKQEAEKSAQSSVGFLENADDRATISGISIVNPLWEQGESWNEERMSAAMDSYLNGYKDPRESKFFKTAGDGKYHGVRVGVGFTNNSNWTGDKISKINVSQSQSLVYFSAAESFFLRAEGALRGWSMGGTAKDFYEAGIRASFAELGVTDGVSAYISNSTNKPADFVDNSGHGDDIKAMSTVTIAWNEGDAFETKLEKIITQKWIANFSISPEGWAEYRRTGYPKLFPIVKNNSNGLVSTELQIRRMPYPSTEYEDNADAVAEGVKLLNGADNGGTKLWWDKNPNH